MPRARGAAAPPPLVAPCALVPPPPPSPPQPCARRLTVLYPCVRCPWTRRWWESTLFASHRLVCYEEATHADVAAAHVVVAAFRTPREKREGWEFSRSLVRRLALPAGALRGKVLVHVDDEYGARRAQRAEDWAVYCSLYAGWRHVFRNYWSEAWEAMVPRPAEGAAWLPGRLNCSGVCGGGASPRVEWIPLGWSSNWRPHAAAPRPSTRRGVFLGFYGNEKYQLRPNRAALIGRFEEETGVKVTRHLGRVGFGKGNLSHYERQMRDTQLCLQISGLSAECYRMYESLDAGCVPVVVDQFGQETAAQYRFLLGERRRLAAPPPFLRAAAPAALRGELERLRREPAAVLALQAATARWWNHSLQLLRGRLQHIAWASCDGRRTAAASGGGGGGWGRGGGGVLA